MSTITAIGFTNKYYTLWEISEETRPLGNGRSYIVTRYNYIKNISFDKETAISKYPNAIIDENLKGKTRSWETKKEVWDNVDTFRFGKYKGEKITDSDISYLEWYWDQVDSEHKDYVSKILVENGYEIRKYCYKTENGTTESEYLMSPECLREEARCKEELNKKIAELNTGNVLDLFIESNPDYEGNYRDGNIIYHFQEVKENYYQGFSYYLPVINGKAKRIKNKKIVIKRYEWKVENDNLTIEILDFEIAK